MTVHEGSHQVASNEGQSFISLAEHVCVLACSRRLQQCSSNGVLVKTIFEASRCYQTSVFEVSGAAPLLRIPVQG